MKVLIEKQNIDKQKIEGLKDRCNQALDLLWKSDWITGSMGKADRAMADPIGQMGKEIWTKCQVAVIIATGHIGRTIESAIGGVEPKAEMPEVLVFGESLSAGDYAKLITRLEKEDFVLVGVTEGEESLQFRAAFATIKHLLIEKYGTAQATERIYAIAGKDSILLSGDASENDYPLINYPEDVDGLFGANTGAVLLPLAIKGVDLGKYLEGFYDMLSSPEWDLDGADYAMARVAYLSEENSWENLLIWQEEFKGLGRWEEAFGMRVLTMPRDEELDNPDAFNTMITVKEGWSDIMTPSFAGCNEDGSLNLLLQDTWEKYFSENKGENPKIHIVIERLDDYTLGQFLAFLQLSNGITKILLDK